MSKKDLLSWLAVVGAILGTLVANIFTIGITFVFAFHVDNLTRFSSTDCFKVGVIVGLLVMVGFVFMSEVSRFLKTRNHKHFSWAIFIYLAIYFLVYLLVFRRIV